MPWPRWKAYLMENEGGWSSPCLEWQWGDSPKMASASLPNDACSKEPLSQLKSTFFYPFTSNSKSYVLLPNQKLSPPRVKVTENTDKVNTLGLYFDSLHVVGYWWCLWCGFVSCMSSSAARGQTVVLSPAAGHIGSIPSLATVHDLNPSSPFRLTPTQSSCLKRTWLIYFSSSLLQCVPMLDFTLL